VPSVASEINAAQQSRFHHSQARSRTDGNDRSQSSPFADLLDSTTPPATEPPPAPRTARTDKSDDSRPADQNRQADAASNQNTANNTKAAGDSLNAANANDGKNTDATTKDAKSGDDNAKTTKTTKTDDSTTGSADADSGTKTDGDLAAALQAMVVAPTQQPPAADPNAVAVLQPAVTDASQANAAAGAGQTPQPDALAALQAAEQSAAAMNAGVSDQAQTTAAADEAKGKGQAADDSKGDGTVKKDAKADGKGDVKALTQAKADVAVDAKTAAVQPKTDSDDDTGPQSGDKPADPNHHNVAKPASDISEPDARGHRTTDVGGAKTGVVQNPHINGNATAVAADIAASTTAAAAASPGISTTPAQPQPATPAHLQAQLQTGADTSTAVPLSGVAVEIATQATAGKRQFEIRLDPPELGRIDVKLDIDKNGNTTTRLVVERTDTLDLLKRDSQQLERALQQAGLKTSDNGLEFSLRQQSAQSDDQGSSKATTLVVPDEDAAPLPVQRQGYGRLLGMSGGLDIRV
jgi:flagellar hook-length control protein FliK